MAVVGEIFKLVQKWERSGQIWYNVYHYEVNQVIDGTSQASVDLCSAFIEDVQPLILELVSSFVTVTEYECQSLVVPSDYNVTFPGAGNAGLVVGVEALPEQWTLTMKCYRPYPPLRNGYKRFGGIAESVVSGDSVAIGFASDIDNLSNALGSDISSTAGDYVFRPIILPGAYEGGTTPPPWRANRWRFARMGTQRTRMPA